MSVGYPDTINKKEASPFKSKGHGKDNESHIHKSKDKVKGNFLLDNAAKVAGFITNPVASTVKAYVNKTGAFEKRGTGRARREASGKITSNSTDFFGGPSSKAISDYNKSVDKKNKKNGMSAKMTQLKKKK